MKDTHHCPKCDSTRIVKYEGSQYYQGNVGATTKWGVGVAILDRYFCTNCGFTEEYVRMNDKFMKWADKKLKEQGNHGDGFV